MAIDINENVPSSAPFMQSFTGMMEHLSQFERPPSQMFIPVSLTSDPTHNVRTESSSSPQYHGSIEQYVFNEEETYLDNERVSNDGGLDYDEKGLSDEGDYDEDDLSDEGEGNDEGVECEQQLVLVNVGDNVQPTQTTSSSVPFYDQLEEDVERGDSTMGAQNSCSLEGDEFVKGMEFSSKKNLIEAVKSYCIKANQSYTCRTSNKSVLDLVCPNSCGWILRARQKNSDWNIVTYKGPHTSTCVSDNHSLGARHLNSSIIGHFIKECVRVDPTLKVGVIIEMVNTTYHHRISYFKAWTGKQAAIAEIYGSWEESYERLPRYMQALRDAHPGMAVEWVYKSERSGVNVFKRLFWAFKPCIDGFAHCLPVLVIDGTHLYGKYKGKLLTAIGIDGNNQLMPLAFALVEEENVDSWSWFMACIRHRVTRKE